jgi:hypothetical protein
MHEIKVKSVLGFLSALGDLLGMLMWVFSFFLLLLLLLLLLDAL